MSKKKKVLLMLLAGNLSQADIASVNHCSKRDVSAAARLLRERGLTAAEVAAMGDGEVEELLSPPSEPAERRDPRYLQPDMKALVERKRRNRRLPVKLMWFEYGEEAAAADRLAYSYQTFCAMFAEASQASDARQRFEHAPGEKVYIDWAGDVAWVTDRLTGKRSKVYVIVFCLPCSCKFTAKGFPDMKEASWLQAHAEAFEFFGGVPQMLIPDNCATATDRSAVYVTLVNKTYEQFAEHYGTAVVPARVRKPRDKSLAEGTVDLVEQWIIAPSNEMVFHSLEEFNEYCAGQVAWLNSRPFSDKEGSRDSAFEDGEREHLMPLPPTRFETYVPRTAKVQPDYHVRIDYMRYSVPHVLIGRTVDVRLYASRVVVSYAGEVVAEHPRLRGRKGQFSTDELHMPPNHAMMSSPWSPERLRSWARRIGPSTAEAVERMLASRVIVQQAFVGCTNVLGLSKPHGADLLERACARIVAVEGAVPSYTAVKNAIAAIKAAEAEARAKGAAPASGPDDGELVDRAKGAGRVSGADAWRRGREGGEQ